MITAIEVHKGSLGSKRGWAFSVFFERDYPNFISALYKTQREAIAKSEIYRKTGKFDWYGSAEN